MTETATDPQRPRRRTRSEIVLQQIYLKDCSYEAPNGPAHSAARVEPEVLAEPQHRKH